MQSDKAKAVRRILSADILMEIMPTARREKAELYAEPLRRAMLECGISTVPRATMFLAQIAHESGSLNFVRELWGPTEQQRGYEGRKDLGNTQTGDGFKYRGRGLIQVTGRANYAECGKALVLDLIKYPELLETPDGAARSACWFWLTRGLNTLADAGDFIKVTKRINGGTTGLAARVGFRQRAEKAFEAWL
ncbi:glycoside hydrolase family 19 protein [Massilia sp. METH4]|uniref:glycoside hydrolase family 19 protein n=1 Tax=Massilia sp. METH4 TaxID=3123041 RepID=UPI0030CEDE17